MKTITRRHADGSMEVLVRLKPEPAALLRAVAELEDDTPLGVIYWALRDYAVGALVRGGCDREREVAGIFDDNAPEENEGAAQHPPSDDDTILAADTLALVKRYRRATGREPVDIVNGVLTGLPLPKDINNPQVRAAWMAVRRHKLAEFDRLVGKGLSESKAARAVGCYSSSIQAMRRSLEQMESGRHYGRSGGAGARIDLGLSLLSCLRKPAERLTCEDIAAWCDCSRAQIQRIEQRALRKVRLRLLATPAARRRSGSSAHSSGR